jgi:hypothetical protein
MITDLNSINGKFLEFHKKNPNIYLMFKSVAYELHLAGETRLGSKYITELMRYKFKVRVNNLFTSRYARKFVQEFPSYKSLFILKPINEQEIDLRTIQESKY